MGLREKLEGVLPSVSKPNRYLGNELNVIRKDHSSVEVKIALAFPDVYEIGQSYLGFQILYHIINKREDALAERVFAPWSDMEEKMRRDHIPLFSVESTVPIWDFDIVGFTLQYELNYTNILNMLDLSGIPLFSAEREEGCPIVLGGGPCAFNPEPLAEFFDAFAIGDGEEVIGEIIDLFKASRRESREEKLRELARIDGVYVPSLYSVEYNADGSFRGIFPKDRTAPEIVQARIAELKAENYPSRPLVPLTEITHDRLSVEVMRGCTRGCRFCSDGMIYRPVRERPVADLAQQIESGINASGWEEVSLVSLSTSDYSGVYDLISQLDPLLSAKRIALSLPSIRMDNFSVGLAKSIATVRRTGLTFAPEAGTQRLRDVINKNLDERELLQTVRTAYSAGWNSVKLYFMIGLPTETQEDLDGIVNLIRKIVAIGKKSKGGKNVNVSISPFSPKPNTPFQWDAQGDLEVLREKSRYLRRRIPWRAVRLRWRQPEVSLIEAAFARGDRRFSKALVDAWNRGAKFDSWSDFFNFERWLDAFSASSLDPRKEVGTRIFDSPLPWDHISAGVTKDFLRKERARASIALPTPDCRLGCIECGLTGEQKQKRRLLISPGVPPKEVPRIGENVPALPTPDKARQTCLPSGGRDRQAGFGRRRKKSRFSPQPAKASPERPPAFFGARVRLKYAKGPELRFIGHLDLVRIFQRAIRRSGLPIAYSQGFHPHLKIAFGPPLTLGMTSEAEYVDLQFAEPCSGSIKDKLGAVLPSGLEILQEKPIFGKTESLNKAINIADYMADLGSALSSGAGFDINGAIHKVLEAEELPVQRRTKDSIRRVNIRPSIRDVSLVGDDSSVKIRLLIGGADDARPAEVFRYLLALLNKGNLTGLALKTVRTGLYIEKDGKIFTPMEVI